MAKSHGPPADEDKAELEPKPESTQPDKTPPRAKVVHQNARAAGSGQKRFCCRGSGAGYPLLYILADDADNAEKLYRQMHGLHYHKHIAVFIDELED